MNLFALCPALRFQPLQVDKVAMLCCRKELTVSLNLDPQRDLMAA
jgi:hypothetical protein